MGILNVDEFLGRFDTPGNKQCATKSPSGRCPDVAYYAVTRDDRPEENYCMRCVTAALFYGTKRGPVTVRRVAS